MSKTLALVPHPGFPSGAIERIEVTLGRRGDRIDLGFAIFGAVEGVSWPGGRMDGSIHAESADDLRADELWRHTCFEAFIAPAGGTHYREVNLATSGHWAAYAFDGYRAGMRPAGEIRLLGADWRFAVRRADVSASIAVPHGEADWALNVTAVIEATDGGKSYWALAHALGAPDFHNRDCFAATLRA